MPSTRKELPSLTLIQISTVVAMGYLCWGIFSVIVAMFTASALDALYTFVGVLMICGAWLGWSVWKYKKILRIRAEVRHEREQELLSRKWPDTPPPIDWPEIERAMEAMVAAGVEPTYERAQDWIRSPQRRRTIELMVERELQYEEAHVPYCGWPQTGVCDQPGPCEELRHGE